MNLFPLILQIILSTFVISGAITVSALEISDAIRSKKK